MEIFQVSCDLWGQQMSGLRVHWILNGLGSRFLPPPSTEMIRSSAPPQCPRSVAYLSSPLEKIPHSVGPEQQAPAGGVYEDASVSARVLWVREKGTWLAPCACGQRLGYSQSPVPFQMHSTLAFPRATRAQELAL